MRRLMLLAAGAALGCASPYPPLESATETGIARQTTISYDPYGKSTEVRGPLLSLGAPLGPSYAVIELREFLFSDGRRVAQVYVEHTHRDGWHEYTLALDLDGRQHVLDQIGHDAVCPGDETLGCAYTEKVAVEFTETDLRVAGKSNGLQLSIRGNGGEFDLAVPPAVVRGFVSRIPVMGSP